jgi:hypothetical protein
MINRRVSPYASAVAATRVVRSSYDRCSVSVKTAMA